MQKITESLSKKPRYSISVSSRTYERLRAAAAPGSIAGLVDEIVMNALEDPGISAELAFRCRQAGAQL